VKLNVITVSRFITDCYELHPTGCLKCVVKLGVQNRMWICLLNCVHNNIKIFVTSVRRESNTFCY